MKKLWTILLGVNLLTASAQIINKDFNLHTHEKDEYAKSSISAGDYNLNIKTSVIYNAIPDGYRVTFTTSFIGKSVEEIEISSEQKIKTISKELKKLVDENDIISDWISIDPIFYFDGENETRENPSAYKITQNLSFKIKAIRDLEPLSRICIKHGIYDLIDVVPFLENTDPIHDSLRTKSVNVLDQKKQMASNMGFTLSGGKPNFNKNVQIYYPNERYLKSYVKSSTLYRHHFSQNATLDQSRKLDVDNYYNLNLKDADYIFNPDCTEPVIQFLYTVNFNYHLPPPPEPEKAEPEKTMYIIDKKGNLKKVDW